MVKPEAMQCICIMVEGHDTAMLPAADGIYTSLILK
jgi:hypothetical protein